MSFKKITVSSILTNSRSQVTRTLSNPSFKAKCDREEVSCRDLQLLGPKKWLNDEIINFYGALLMERAEKEGKRKIHFFNSFFFSKMAKDGYEKSKIGRWTKKVSFCFTPLTVGMEVELI
jgi:sentrin-specific protease 1